LIVLLHTELTLTERISEELDDAWKDISLAYEELVVCVLPLLVR
jgi:hypothetical protein